MSSSQKPRWRWTAYPTGSVLALALFITPACDDYDEFRTDVMLCEEAVAYLDSCCPSTVTAKIRCSYSYDHDGTPASDDPDRDCGGPGCGCAGPKEINPDFSERESRCILGRVCSNLPVSGVCERIRARARGAAGRGSSEVCL
jgi:hypothetical protein